MQGFPTGFWGKLRHDERGRVVAWHSVADHCADVAAVAEALLERTLLRRRLARLAGRDDLTDVQVARLGVLAALHDVGKFNTGFQNKAFWPRPFSAGHMSEILALFDDDAGYAESNRLIETLDMAALWPWAEGEAIGPLLVATISHHGKPQPIGRTIGPELWKPCRGLDPFDGIRDLVARTRRWFPKASQEHAAPLPADPAFQHGWSVSSCSRTGSARPRRSSPSARIRPKTACPSPGAVRGRSSLASGSTWRAPVLSWAMSRRRSPR